MHKRLGFLALLVFCFNGFAMSGDEVKKALAVASKEFTFEERFFEQSVVLYDVERNDFSFVGCSLKEFVTTFGYLIEHSQAQVADVPAHLVPAARILLGQMSVADRNKVLAVDVEAKNPRKTIHSFNIMMEVYRQSLVVLRNL